MNQSYPYTIAKHPMQSHNGYFLTERRNVVEKFVLELVYVKIQAGFKASHRM